MPNPVVKTLSVDTELLTAEKAAVMLDVEVQTLALWRSTKRVRIPYVRLGRAVRYRREHIQKFIEENTIT